MPRTTESSVSGRGATWTPIAPKPFLRRMVQLPLEPSYENPASLRELMRLVVRSSSESLSH